MPDKPLEVELIKQHSHDDDIKLGRINDNNSNDITKNDNNINTEGDLTTTSPKNIITINSKENIADNSLSDDDDLNDDNGTSIFGKFLKPTSVIGEKSPNVPQVIECNYKIISAIIFAIIISILFIISLFCRKGFEYWIQSMNYFLIDCNPGLDNKCPFNKAKSRPFAVFVLLFGIFDINVFNIANLDVLFNISSAYLFNNIVIGTVIYIIGLLIGSMTAFFLGQKLFREKFFFHLSKHEIYRKFDTVWKDYSLTLIILFRLNPFIPSGFVSYAFSVTSISWKRFLCGSIVSILPAIMIANSAEYIENISSDIIVGSYKNNGLSYAFIVIFCCIFGVGIIIISYLLIRDYMNLNKDKIEQQKSEDNEVSLQIADDDDEWTYESYTGSTMSDDDNENKNNNNDNNDDNKEQININMNDDNKDNNEIMKPKKMMFEDQYMGNNDDFIDDLHILDIDPFFDEFNVNKTDVVFTDEELLMFTNTTDNGGTSTKTTKGGEVPTDNETTTKGDTTTKGNDNDNNNNNDNINKKYKRRKRRVRKGQKYKNKKDPNKKRSLKRGLSNLKIGNKKKGKDIIFVEGNNGSNNNNEMEMQNDSNAAPKARDRIAG